MSIRFKAAQVVRAVAQKSIKSSVRGAVVALVLRVC